MNLEISAAEILRDSRRLMVSRKCILRVLRKDQGWMARL